jgi:hypothetical protein
MAIDCPASFKIVDGSGGGAIVKNLSGGGLLMLIDHEIVADSEMQIEIKPVNDITPPMVADVRVLRCSRAEDPAGSFFVACQISRLLG